MSNLDYRTKMLWHIREMEAAAASISRLETQALHHAQAGRLRRISSLVGRSTPDEYHAKRALEDNFWYQALISKRDGHQRAAQLYALAALVERPVGPLPGVFR